MKQDVDYQRPLLQSSSWSCLATSQTLPREFRMCLDLGNGQDRLEVLLT